MNFNAAVVAGCIPTSEPRGAVDRRKGAGDACVWFHEAVASQDIHVASLR